MKSVGLLAFALIVPLLVVGGAWFAMGPLHDWQGKRNTQYSANFSRQNFNRITYGMTPAAVTNLLGTPVGERTDSDYPAWAVSDLATRQQSNISGNVRIEWLYFSRPIKDLVDYEWVQVVLGPDRTVISKNSYVTD
jgi:hypothetical protein